MLDEDGWRRVGVGLPDRAEVLAAYLRAIRRRSATAADRDLLQAPFRTGIRLDAYQLLPLRKALRLPRVNLLIPDDAGLGKTVGAGLVARVLMLRRRIDFIVFAAAHPFVPLPTFSGTPWNACGFARMTPFVRITNQTIEAASGNPRCRMPWMPADRRDELGDEKRLSRSGSSCASYGGKQVRVL